MSRTASSHRQFRRWAYITLSRNKLAWGDEGGALESARQAERLARDSGADLQIALNAMGGVAAWAVLNTAYALYYAHTYHGNDENSACLKFPGGKKPGTLDFAYFSFAVGTSFAASDVKAIGMVSHRVVPGHTIRSFAYSTVLIAVVVNVKTDFSGAVSDVAGPVGERRRVRPRLRSPSLENSDARS